MSFQWPEFRSPIPIDERRSWAAEFESYDQHYDDCYYVVTVHEDGREIVKMMAKVPLWIPSDDWNTPDFELRLKAEIHAIAATGRANTDYRGPVGRPLV